MSEPDHRTNHLALVHEVKGLVDIAQRQDFGDHLVDTDLSLHVAIHVTGQLCASLHASERRSTPDATGDQLERACADFLAGAGNANDDRLSPALVAALERSAHDVDVANTLEGIVRAAIGHVDDDLLNGPV